jgi:hypothetical protein
MKITGISNIKWDKKNRILYVRPSVADISVIEKFFIKKEQQEEKTGEKCYPFYSFEIASRDKTFSQVKAIWALITVIFRSLNGRKPDEEEKYDLYSDILDMYADKIPNRFTGALRPVHLSESDIYQAGRIISACIDVLTEYCSLNDVRDENGKEIGGDLQNEVRSIFLKWTNWRGGIAKDPLDYDQNGIELPLDKWLEKHKMSDITGVNDGTLEVAHIVSRGSDSADIERSWNWIVMEHKYYIEIQQGKGWETLFNEFPSIKPRVLRARSLAGKLKEA